MSEIKELLTWILGGGVQGVPDSSSSESKLMIYKTSELLDRFDNQERLPILRQLLNIGSQAYDQFLAHPNNEDLINTSAHLLQLACLVEPRGIDTTLQGQVFSKYWQILDFKFAKSSTLQDLEEVITLLSTRHARNLPRNIQSAAAISAANCQWIKWKMSPNTAFGEALSLTDEIQIELSTEELPTTELKTLYSHLQNHVLAASQTYSQWFQNQEVLLDLNAAVSCAALAQRLTRPCDPLLTRQKVLRHFGSESKTRYEWMGLYADLENGFQSAETVLTMGAHVNVDNTWDATRYGMRLSSISRFADRPDRYDEILDLLHQKASKLPAWPERHVQSDIYPKHRTQDAGLDTSIPKRPFSSDAACILMFISTVYLACWQKRLYMYADSKLLDQTLNYAKRSVAALPDGDSLMSLNFDTLTTTYLASFLNCTENMLHLNGAVEAATKSLGLAWHNYADMGRSPRQCERLCTASIHLSGEVLITRYVAEGHNSDLDAAIHANEIGLQSLPSNHAARTCSLQSYCNKLYLKVQSCLQNVKAGREGNLYSRLAYLIKQSPSKEYLGMSMDDLYLLEEQIRVRKNLSTGDKFNDLRRPRAVAVQIGNEATYSDFMPYLLPRGSYPDDLKLSIDFPGLITENSLICRSNVNIQQSVEFLEILAAMAEASQNGQIPPYCKIFAPRTQIDPIFDTISEALELAEWAAQGGYWSILEPLWSIYSRALAASNFQYRIAELSKMLQCLSRMAILAATSMMTHNCDTWRVILMLESTREELSCRSFLPGQALRTKFSPFIERQVKEIILDLESPGIERATPFRRSEFRDLEHFERKSSELFQAMSNLKTCLSDLAPFGKADVIRQSYLAPIVMLLASDQGAHAIVVTPFTVKSIALSAFDFKACRDNLSSSRIALKMSGRKRSLLGGANAALRTLLKALWSTVAVPVLSALDIPLGHVQELKHLPRIQWIPCGIFSQVPIHAAGDFRKGRHLFLAQYVVSSYLSSVRLTTLTRRKQKYSAPEQHNIMVFTMPVTEPAADGSTFADLDTRAEVEAIKSALPPGYGSTFLQNSDLGALQGIFRGARIAHFACHGIPHHGDPTKSRLVIAGDGRNPLTIAQIRMMSSSSARLAFLSACHGVSVDDLDSSELDDATHLVKAFQLAGFPSVVGCMWQAFDEDSATISGAFYSHLAKSGFNNISSDNITRSLHYAVSKLRDKNLYNLASWASWVHYGD